MKTGKEKIAEMMVGIESEATTYNMNEKNVDDMLRSARIEKFNQDVGDLQERFQKHLDDIREASEALAADMQNIEIMPLNSYALITPFKTNPFQKIETRSGLIIGGFAPEFKSEETGETDEEKQWIKVGMVTETGAECKFLEPGDIVFYNTASEVQVPFFRFGFVIVNEQRILSVVGEHLTERKEAYKNRTAGTV